MDWLIPLVHLAFGSILFQAVSFGEWNTYTTLLVYGGMTMMMLVFINYLGYASAAIFAVITWASLLLVFSTADISRKYHWSHYLS